MNKVCHIGTFSFEDQESKRELKSIGGISGYILDLVNYSVSEGFCITFVGKIYNYSERKGLKYYEVQRNISNTNMFLFHLLFKSLFIKLDNDVIIHGHRPDHLAIFSLFRKNTSLLTLHGQQAKTINLRKKKLTRTIYHNLEKSATKKAKVLIAVDNETKSYYSLLYPNISSKIITIPSGVNTREFYPKRKRELRNLFGYSDKDRIIIYVGRIEPPKKVEVIIKAISKVVENSSRYKLLIVGDGVSIDDNKSLVNNLGLSSHVTFLGIRKRIELPDLYNLADASVLYSENEGSPLSVKESLACGIPVVANAVGDIPEVLQNGYNGYIIEHGGAEELAEKFILACNNSQDMKKNCVNSIREFTSEVVCQEVLKLYHQISNE